MTFEQDFGEKILKLRILGYVEKTIRSRGVNIDEIHFYRPEDIERRDKYSDTSLGGRHLATYIFCFIKMEWTKVRMPIPPLTNTERVLYARG